MDASIFTCSMERRRTRGSSASHACACASQARSRLRSARARSSRSRAGLDGAVGDPRRAQRRSAGVRGVRPDQRPCFSGDSCGISLDQSASSARDAALLSPWDRRSLGVSSAHAALVGLSFSARLFGFEPWLEWTWDPLISDRIDVLASPMHVIVGLRPHLLARDQPLLAGIMLDVSPSARASNRARRAAGRRAPREAALMSHDRPGISLASCAEARRENRGEARGSAPSAEACRARRSSPRRLHEQNPRGSKAWCATRKGARSPTLSS